MALFKTIDEIKLYLSVTKAFKFDSILPYIKQAEAKYIIPAISQAQYDPLNTAYNATTPTLTTDQTNLLDKIRLPLANLSYLLYIPVGQLQLDDAGIRIANTENMKTAFEWQIEMLKKSFQDAGFDGLETLLKFLETNKTIYTLWAASTSYTEFKTMFINTASDFSKYYNINNSRRTFLAINGIMKKVEELIIKPAISTTLYDAIKAQLLTTISSENQTIITNYIKPAIANFTISRAIAELSVIMTEYGISVFNNDSTKQATQKEDASRLSNLQQIAEADGKNYLKQLRDYLNTTASATVYPLYFASDLYIDTTSATETFENDSASGIVGLL